MSEDATWLNRDGDRQIGDDPVSTAAFAFMRAAACSREPGVFKANVEGPWIDPDAASPEELMQVAINCPSGAIHVDAHRRRSRRRPNPKVNTITIRENGPLAVYAEIDLAGERDRIRAPRSAVAASSKNKPYCDGSHAAAGFRQHRRTADRNERSRSPSATASSPSRPTRTDRSASPARSRS